jgi:hypothetical protein
LNNAWIDFKIGGNFSGGGRHKLAHQIYGSVALMPCRDWVRYASVELGDEALGRHWALGFGPNVIDGH